MIHLGLPSSFIPSRDTPCRLLVPDKTLFLLFFPVYVLILDTQHWGVWDLNS